MGELEGENAKLKKLLVEAHLDMEALKTAFSKLSVNLTSRMVRRSGSWALLDHHADCLPFDLWGYPEPVGALH